MEIKYWGSKDELEEIELKEGDIVLPILEGIFTRHFSRVYVVFFKETDIDSYKSFFVSNDKFPVCSYIEDEMDLFYNFYKLSFESINIHGFNSYKEAFEFCTDLKEGC